MSAIVDWLKTFPFPDIPDDCREDYRRVLLDSANCWGCEIARPGASTAVEYLCMCRPHWDAIEDVSRRIQESRKRGPQ